MGRAKIQDVARAAGVSSTSVSNYLNGRFGEMRQETCARIAEAIRQLGYVPNSAARQLKTGHSRIIGLLVPSVLNPYFAELAAAVDAAAQKKGLHVILCNTQRNPERELAFVRELVAQGVRGIIAATVLKENIDPMGEFIRKGIAFVVFENIGADDRLGCVDVVTMDHEQAAEMAVDCLAGLGHRAIAYVTPTPLNPHRLSRLQGFRRAMRKHGLGEGVVITNEAMPSCTKAYEEADLSRFGHLAAHEFARLSSRPTAVIAMNDIVAFGMLSGFYELGIPIPADVSLIGIDGIGLSRFVSPSLTTIRQPYAQIAESAIDCLHTRLADPERGASTIILEPSLDIRVSTAPPPAR